jgi:hypothetical protein
MAREAEISANAADQKLERQDASVIAAAAQPRRRG